MQAFAYQVISHNNDRNGNPFRLVLVFNSDLQVIKAVECRSSMPNYLHEDHIKMSKQLPSYHLSPSEYNETKKAYGDKLEHSY